MRLTRDGDHHTPRELTLSVMLSGEFDAAWTAGDNRACIATDSVKNIVNVTAARNLGLDKKAFAAAVAKVLLGTYPQIESMTIEAEETRWLRHVIDGEPHGHTFTRDGIGTGYVALVATRDGSTLRSGLRDYTFMKTTQSGWSGFVEDRYRTLPDTTDRIAATSMDATWRWSEAPASCETANARVLGTLIGTFGTGYSRGIQDSMYRMGVAALAAVREVAEITFVMPNKHYVPIDLSAFGLDNPGTVFVPTDEPSGRIEATITRGG